jgi:hypothetical protein
MQFSQEYITALVVILITILPRIGVQIGSVELTTLIQAVFTVAGGVWIMWRRFQRGDITTVGVRKE